MLLAPPWNVLRGVEGGAAVGVIYFVNIFRPQGPHSHPPWLISRMRLSARESIISSGYGPFKVFPQLSLSFSLGSWGAMVSCPAMQPPQPQGPSGRLTGLCSSRLMAPGPTGPISSACLTGPWVSHLAAPICLSSPRPASCHGHQPDFCHPKFFCPLTNPVRNPWSGNRGLDFPPQGWLMGSYSPSAFSFFLNSLKRPDI